MGFVECNFTFYDEIIIEDIDLESFLCWQTGIYLQLVEKRNVFSFIIGIIANIFREYNAIVFEK